MFSYATPVRFADVDHAGIVYYPRFFHYFHLAFEELWRARIGPQAYSEIIDRDRIGFPAVRAECDFKAPLKFGDTAEIEVSIPRLGTKSITFRYRIYRAAVPTSEATSEATSRVTSEPTSEATSTRALCAEGQVVCAVVDLARFAAVAIPEHVAEMLRDLVES